MTPTTLNRPVKDMAQADAEKDASQQDSDLFAVASKPRPNFVSESDNCEELDFELGKILILFI